MGPARCPKRIQTRNGIETKLHYSLTVVCICFSLCWPIRRSYFNMKSALEIDPFSTVTNMHQDKDILGGYFSDGIHSLQASQISVLTCWNAQHSINAADGNAYVLRAHKVYSRARIEKAGRFLHHNRQPGCFVGRRCTSGATAHQNLYHCRWSSARFHRFHLSRP